MTGVKDKEEKSNLDVLVPKTVPYLFHPVAQRCSSTTSSYEEGLQFGVVGAFLK